MIRAATLGVAACDADHKVKEEGGNNRGPRVRAYLDNANIAVAAPWCAAAVQYWSDVAARALGIQNPLDGVRQEALVQSYFDYLGHMQVGPAIVQPGDLVLFKFGQTDRWNHIGIVAQSPENGTFWSVEGNTSTTDDRDGDGVSLKPRQIDAGYEVCFITWGDGEPIE